jgi:2-dehydro-3-deoxy-L-rhamnonate dehydrogenase (NAD+)
VVVDVDEANVQARAAELEAGGGRARAYRMDVTDTANVEAVVADVFERYGRIDILVNNAAISGALAHIIDCPDEAWAKTLDVNVQGPFRCTRAVLPKMIKAGYGRIVNIASISGKEGTPVMLPAYAASKAALIGFTKNAGRDVAGTGVLVNCIAPAGIPTTGFMDWKHVPDERRQSSSPIPLRRNLDPLEIGAMVVWLASEECSLSTGAVFDITGGRSTY